MADLHPTPTRLALLGGVQAGQVIGYPPYGSDENAAYYWDFKGGVQRVTKRVEELLRAGWVEKGDKHFETPYSTFSMLLTEEGRKVLEAGRGT